jgi:hypothetical protein
MHGISPRINFQNTLTYPNAPAGPAQVNGKPHPPCHDRDKSLSPFGGRSLSVALLIEILLWLNFGFLLDFY